MAGRNRYYKRKLYFSTQDRILLHLLDFVGYEGEFNQPDEMTQFGIADSICLGRSTVSKAIRRLTRQGLVKSARAHVPSGTLRRTAYFLTETGVGLANRRKVEVEEDVVLFQDGTVERRLRMSQIPGLVPEYATLVDVACHVSEGVFDARTFESHRGQKFVDLTDRVPRLRYFFGRDRELAAMDGWLASPEERVLVVTGITGIGKTTLLSRKIEDWRGQRHVLFYRIMDWSALHNVVSQLAEFLTRLSKKQLAQYLESEKGLDIEQIVAILRTDLDGVPAVLVYDDYHTAEPSIRNFFYAFRAALEAMQGVRLVVAGRSVPPFYDRRDVKVRGTVHELPLGGLDNASGEKILQVRNLALPPDSLGALLRQTAGHPLFLELVDPGANPAADIHKYLEEELFSRITDVEAKVLTIASVFRFPVHADGLFIDETVDTATIRGLLEQSLLREVSARVYEVHDVVRAFFLEMMTPQERRRYNRWAAQFCVSRVNPEPLEALFHFVEAEDVTSAARVAVREGRGILASGRSEELLRLVERLLPSVEDVAQSAELRLLRAEILDVRGELDQAMALYREILALPADTGLEPKIAEAHRGLGDVLRRQGRFGEAEPQLEAALRIYRGLDDREGQAEALLGVGSLAEDLSDQSRAERAYERGLAFAQAVGKPILEAKFHVAFSRLMDARGDYAAALDRKEKAVELAEGLGDWHLQARVQVSRGTSLYSLGRISEALEAYERGIETARRIGDRRMLGYGLWNAAGACIKQNDLLRAESYLRESEGLFHRLREPAMEALVFTYYGYLWEKRGKWQLARQNLSTGLNLLRSSGPELDFARHALSAGQLMHRHGEEDEAISLLQEAATVARRIRAASIADEAQKFVALYAAHPGGRTTVEPSRDATSSA